MLPAPQDRQPRLLRAGLLLLLALPGLARADQKPQARPPDKETQAQLRNYLPVLLEKALLENDRELVARMEKLVGLCEVFSEGGILAIDKLGEARKQLLEDRVYLLRRQTAYSDALDRYRSRFDVPAERLQKWEDGARGPLLRHLRAFETLYEDWGAAREPVLRASDPKKSEKLRPLIEKAVTSSKLVQRTRSRPAILKSWKAWKDVKDLHAALGELRTEREELRHPRVANNTGTEELPAPGQPAAPNPVKKKAPPRRMQDILFEIDVGELELALRDYEQESWKEEKNPVQHLCLKANRFYHVWRTFSGMLDYAFVERLARVERSCPVLPALRIDKVDLLTCKPEQAVEVVTRRARDKTAALSVRSLVRKLRAAAEIYPLQQQAVSLVYLQRANRQDQMSSPAPMSEGDTQIPAPRPKLPDAELPMRLLDTQHALARARADLLRTWLDYHQLRLELYRQLDLTPP